MSARHEILGGKVHLYQRPKSPFWQVDATVGGRQFKKSSKTDSLAQAKDFAQDWYLTLQGKHRFGGGIEPKRSGKTFNQAADQFIREFEAITLGERSAGYVASKDDKLRVHLRPFFGDKLLSEINPGLVQEYRIHRIEKHKEKQLRAAALKRQKEIAADLKPTPEKLPTPLARSTMHHEIVTLRQVLKTANRHGWLEHMPDLSTPYKASGKISHRAWFSLEDYTRLRTTTETRAKSPPNQKWKWECEQFHDYVLFMANTGLRPDEASRLEFRDVTITQNDKPILISDLAAFNLLIARCKEEGAHEPILEIEVRGKRGVGYCKSMPGAVRPFLRLRSRLRAMPEDRSKFTRDRREKSAMRRARGTEPERLRDPQRGVSRGVGHNLVLPKATELIFGPTQREMMNAVLGELGLKFDREGQRRTAYSLRHTYICLRLMEGADIYQIAKNCRTSVEMIEKFYASHIKNTLNAAAINVRKFKGPEQKKEGTLTADKDE